VCVTTERSDSWHPAVFGVGCVLSVVYLASWFFEPTRSLWQVLDDKVFWAFNDSLASAAWWQVLWAVANNRAVDIVAALSMIGLFAHFVLCRARDRTDFFVAVGLMLTGLILIGNRISAVLPVERKSPTLLYPDALRLTRLVPWIPTKDTAGDCFPGDHAMVLFLCAGVISYYLPRAYAVVAWVLAAVFMLPRLVGGAHWLTDDLVGAAAVAGFVLSCALATPLHGVVTRRLEPWVGRCRARWADLRRTRGKPRIR
jgi:membrane-associated phospholipid phosphatase